MLTALSGREHRVLTGCCLLAGEQRKTQVVSTQVNFIPLSSEEIERYLDRAHWQDKAGAYAVQEHAAYMVCAISGSYTNVVGLPLSETLSLLRQAGVVD